MGGARHRRRVRFHALHCHWLGERSGRFTEAGFLLGIYGGRVPADPDHRWLYSVRVFLFIVKIEVLWTTG